MRFAITALVLSTVVALAILLLPNLGAEQRSEDDLLTIAALGDSYTSGEGLAVNADDPCQRSPLAWPNLVVDALAADRPVQFASAACSGATSAAVWSDAATDSQLNLVRRQLGDEPLDLVLLTIGGNDIGFGDAIRSCVTPSGGDEPGDEPLSAQLLRGLTPDCDLDEDALIYSIEATIPRTVGATFEELAPFLAPDATVLVGGYPQLLAPTRDWDTTERLLGCSRISPEDSELIRAASRSLNEALETQVRAASERYPNVTWHFVDVASEFENSLGNHNLCGTEDDTWLTSVWEAIAEGVDVGDDGVTIRWPRLQSAFHPNAAGHAAYASAALELVT